MSYAVRLFAALVLSAAALGITATVADLWQHTPLLLPLVAVTASAWLFGAGPAIAGSMLDVVVVTWFWLPLRTEPEHFFISAIFFGLAVVVSTQVSGRRQVLEALRRKTAHHERLVDLSPDAILLHDGHRWTFANAAAAQLFGATTPQELIGRDVLSFVAPQWRDVARARIAHADFSSTASTTTCALIWLR